MDEIKKIASKVTQAQEDGDIELLEEILDPDFKAHIADHPYPLSKDAYIQGVQMAKEAFSNLTYKIEDVIAEKNRVALRIVVEGIHSGNYLGKPAIGKVIKFYSMVIRLVVKGFVVEEWQVNDQMSLLKSIEQ